MKPCVQKRPIVTPIIDCRVRMLLSMHNAVTCNTNFLHQMCSSVVHQSRCQSLSDWTWRQPAVKRTTECCRRLHPRRSWKTRCTGGSGADCTDATDSADAIVDVIVFLLDTLSAAPGCCQRTIANDHVQIMSQKLIRGNRANRFKQITSVQSACARSFKFVRKRHTCTLLTFSGGISTPACSDHCPSATAVSVSLTSRFQI